MFQYATARSLAEKRNTDFLYYGANPIVGRAFDLDYYRNHALVLSKKPFSNYLIDYYFEPRSKSYGGGDEYETYDPRLFRVEDRTEIRGFYQSPRYFDAAKARFWFQPKPSLRARADDLLSDVGNLNQTCCIHIRGGRLYLKWGWALPTAYYRRAVAHLPSGTNVVVITDNTDYAAHVLKGIVVPDAIFSTPNPLLDMTIMSLCRFKIIANSTFSWWGAFRSLSDSSIVFCPEHFIGWRKKEEIPESIYPSGWKQVSFDADKDKSEEVNRDVEPPRQEIDSLSAKIRYQVWNRLFVWDVDADMYNF
jgi:hypothetical protein